MPILDPQFTLQHSTRKPNIDTSRPNVRKLEKIIKRDCSFEFPLILLKKPSLDTVSLDDGISIV